MTLALRAGFLLLLAAFAAPASAAPKTDPRLRSIERRAPKAYSPAAGKPVAQGTASVFLRIRPGADVEALKRLAPGLKITGRAGGQLTAVVPLAALPALDASPDILAVIAPTKGRTNMEVARSQTTLAGPVYLGVFKDSPTGFGVNGANVIVGVIDTGIDYTHGDFKTAGGTTRLLEIWDQTAGSGPAPPGGYGYGAYWTQAQINDEIDGTPAGVVTQTDTAGHGTHVAGIAAGDGSATDGDEPAGTYMGMAPGADIIAVKTDLTSTQVCDALSFLTSRAAAYSKRLVVNMSLGYPFGPHDGTDVVDVCADAAAAAGIVVVAAAGNEAQLGQHAKLQYTGATETKSFSVSRLGGGSLGANDVIEIEIWGPAGDDYTTLVTLGGLSGNVGAAAGVSVTTGTIGAAEVDVYSSILQANGSDVTYIYVYTNGTTPTNVGVSMRRTASAGTGRLDGYVGFDGNGQDYQFLSNTDANGTVASPATAAGVISVGSYNTKMCWVDYNDINECYSPQETIGTISSFSNRGPTRDGRQKPDVAAPGFGIGSSMSADFTPDPFTNFPEFVLRTNAHIVLRGTSMASPMVAGWAALALETFPTLTPAQVKTRVQTDARTDGAVAVGNTWGAGKLTVALKPKTAVTNTSATAVSSTRIDFAFTGVSDASAYDAYDGVNQTTLVQAGISNPFQFTATPNQLKGLYIVPRNPAGTGPGTLTSFTASLAETYPGPGQAAPSVTTQVTTMDVTYSGCAGLAGGCANRGFEVRASADPTFATGVFYSSTTNTGTTTLRIHGLTAAGQYYVRVGNLNQLGIGSFSANYGPFTQQNGIVIPDPAAFSGVTTSQIQHNWSSGGNAFGTTYRSRAFSDAARTTQVGADIALLNGFSAVHQSLSPGTQYWFRVIPEQGAQTGPALDQGPATTNAAVPAAAATPLTGASASSLTATWLANGNGGAATYTVEVSPSDTFASNVTTVNTGALMTAVPGLSPNVLYYGRVRAQTSGGPASAWLSLGSARTLAAAPSPLTFTADFPYGFTATFDDGGNASGATFRVEASRSAAFNLSDDQEFNVGASLSATFSNLIPSTEYFFHVAAYNSSGQLSAYSAAVSGFMLAAPPVAAVPHVLARTTTSLRLAWGKGLNPAGLTYEAELHDQPDFSNLLETQTVAALFADFTVGLSANTRYYARVRTVGQGGQPNSAWLALSPAYTLPSPLGAAAALLDVTYTSATFTWTPVPNCAGYKIEASTEAGFSTVRSNIVSGASTDRGGVPNLPPNTLLHFRVGPVNPDGASNPTGSGTATTLSQNAVSANTTASGAFLQIAPLVGPVQNASLFVPPSAFPVGTNVVVNTSVEFALPNPVSNQARLTKAGAAAGVELTAGGLQPNAPVSLTLRFDPLALPPGMSPRTLQVARYDESAGQWSLIPTIVDLVTNSVTATVDHFSLFGLFGVTPAAALDSVQVFPVPWEINSRDPRFSANSLTISNLPEGARVRVFNMTGESVWEGSAASAGVLNWRGDNRYGGKAGSGTYLVVIDGAGARVVRRAVLVR